MTQPKIVAQKKQTKQEKFNPNGFLRSALSSMSFQRMNNKSRASNLKMGIADDAAALWGENDPKIKKHFKVLNTKSSIAHDADEVFGNGPVITNLEVNTLDVKENFMDEAKD